MTKPKLQFPEFSEDWKKQKVFDLMTRVVNPVKVESETLYEQIGIRSHGKGIFHKEKVSGNQIGNKRIFWLQKDLFVLNIVFAWEQAVAITSEKEEGLVASHRFPMYQPQKDVSYLKYLLFFFLTKKGKFYLELASPGGAGRNKTLGQKEFEKTKFLIPNYSEQKKIADFLTIVDDKIQKLTQKKEALSRYKKGIVQEIFSQRLRFRGSDSKEYPSWESKKLSHFLDEHKKKSEGIEPVYSVSVKKGLINQVEHLGRSYSAKNTGHYNKVCQDDVVYTKSPTGDFKYGIIKQSHITEDVIVSPLYGVFTPKSPSLGFMLHIYFEYPSNAYNYLNPIVQKGAKNTINISNTTFLSKSLTLPKSKEEIEKISAFFKHLSIKIENVDKKIEHMTQFKKGLLQQMFV